LVIGFEGSGMDDGTLQEQGKDLRKWEKNKKYKLQKRLWG